MCVCVYCAYLLCIYQYTRMCIYLSKSLRKNFKYINVI